MTISELQTLRDAAFRVAAKKRVQHGDMSVEYAEAAAAIKLYDDEIARLEAASSSAASRTSYATFSNS